MNRTRRSLAVLSIAAISLLLPGCDDYTSYTYTITPADAPDGERTITYEMSTTGLNRDTDASFPATLRLTGRLSPQWEFDKSLHTIAVEMVTDGASPWPAEEEVILVAGNRGRSVIGGTFFSEVATRTAGSSTESVYSSGVNYVQFKLLVGNTHGEIHIGPMYFRIEDNQIRGIAEFCRKLEAGKE